MRIATILAVVALVSGSVFAGDLATDANAWVNPDTGLPVRGSVLFQDNLHHVLVDYCVYGPGDFTYGSYDVIGGTYTPAANEFVYAYQVFVTELSSVETLTFWVDMLYSNEAHSMGWFTDLVGTTPDDAYISGPNQSGQFNTAVWDFYSCVLPGENSSGLIYSSVNMPTWTEGHVQNGGQAIAMSMPTPSDVIPEPATMTILAMGLLGIARRRR